VTTIAVAILLFLLYSFNRLVGLRNGVRNAWSDIDVQLTRRHDLVANLIESVKGYMIHERATLEAVTQARSGAVRAGDDGATRAAAEMALTSAVDHLLAVAEKYPSLKASENFLLLQDS
jgi:LemA protein